MTHEQRWRNSLPDGEPEEPTGLLKPIGGTCQMYRRPALRENLGLTRVLAKEEAALWGAEQELFDAN